MTIARIHFGPFHLYLSIIESSSTGNQIIHRQKNGTQIISAKYNPTNTIEIQNRIEEILRGFFNKTEKENVKEIDVTASASLHDSIVLNNLRLSMKRRNIKRFKILSFKQECLMFADSFAARVKPYISLYAGEDNFQAIIGCNNESRFVLNLNLGLFYLQSAFIKFDPPEKEEIIALRDKISMELDTLEVENRPENMLLISDAGMALWNLINPNVQLAGNELTFLHKESISSVIPELTKSYTSKITTMQGMNALYVQLIIPTAILFEHILSHYLLDRIEIKPVPFIF